jgi:hypothetical protein
MTSQPLRGWAASGVLAGALALSGCGSGDDKASSATPTRTPAQTATSATSTASLPARMRGSWTRTMRPRDWKPAGSGYPLGTWRLDVPRDGAADVYLPRTDTVDFSPQVAVAEKELTIEDIPVCPGKVTRYSWRATASELTLTVVDDDDCTQGATLFGGTWHRRS